MAVLVAAQAKAGTVRPCSQDGRRAPLRVVALAFPAPAKGTRYVSRAPALSLTSQGAPTSVRGPPSVLDRVSSEIVPFLASAGASYGANLYATVSPGATVEELVSFAGELNGHVEDGQRQRFKGTCNPLTFNFPEGECVWDPTNEEIPAAIQAHLQDRAVDCGVKSVTLVMESDSDVHSVRCLLIGTFVKITHADQGRRVLSSHV